jgi:hypothetical protein
MPQLRKPTSATAASFVESQDAANSPPVLEMVRTVGEEKRSDGAKQAAPKSTKRRMTLYLSKSTAKRLKLESFNREKDMSDIVEDLLAKHLK